VDKQLGPDSRIQRSDEPMQAGLDDEVVMMSIEKGSYYGLDPVGAKIWELLAEPMLVSELVDQLTELYDVEREVCERDTLEFLGSLVGEDLVKQV